MYSPASSNPTAPDVEMLPPSRPPCSLGRPWWAPIHEFAALLWLVPCSSPLLAQQHLTTVQLAKRAIPATVTILAVDSRGDTVGQGSGFIITPNGVVVTNYHVMAGAAAAAVILSTGERFTSTVALAADPATDVAVIKVPGTGLPALPTTTTLPPVGSRVVAIGSPLGLSQTVTDGIVSARRLVEGHEMLQISAPISPGSSGGPVLNDSGAVIAISTAYLQGGQALNFAVPVRYATGILDTTSEPRSLAAVFGTPSRSHPSPSRAPTTPEDLLAATLADSARRAFCTTAYLLDDFRRRMDSLLGQTNPTRLTSGEAARMTAGKAATMTAVLEFFLPKAELYITRFRLAELSADLVPPRANITAVLTHVDSVLAVAAQRVNYRRNPTLADLRSTASTTLEVATLLDREYPQARLPFGPLQPPLPACLDGTQH